MGNGGKLGGRIVDSQQSKVKSEEQIQRINAEAQSSRRSGCTWAEEIKEKAEQIGDSEHHDGLHRISGLAGHRNDWEDGQDDEEQRQ